MLSPKELQLDNQPVHGKLLETQLTEFGSVGEILITISGVQGDIQYQITYLFQEVMMGLAFITILETQYLIIHFKERVLECG